MLRESSRAGFVGIVLVVSILWTALAAAGPPLPRKSNARPGAASRSAARWTAPPVDVARLLEEGDPSRVGFSMATDLSPDDSGIWVESAGDRIWRLELRSPGALWIMLGFDRYRLQRGAELTIHDPERHTVLGPYSHEDIRSHGQLWTRPIAGDTAVVELRWPSRMRGGRPAIHLGTVSHGYKPWAGIGESGPGSEVSLLGGPAPCNIDVNCTEGDSLQNEKHAVVQLLVGGPDGVGTCSGTLINNTRLDCTPYVLTAAHCFDFFDPDDDGCVGGECDALAAATTFLFNFERQGCDTGSAPKSQMSTGSTVVASNALSRSDFLLLEMDNDPPFEFRPFFAGWNRNANQPPDSSWTSIHHPTTGGPKKVSVYNGTLFEGIDFGPLHWRLSEWTEGTTEPGSSGAPLFDQANRIVGQLHGGPLDDPCVGLEYAEYGMFHISWDDGLGAALDSENTGVLTLPGIDGDACSPAGPAVEHESDSVDDAAGNGDGIPDPGDVAFLNVRLLNRMAVPATDVTATLSTEETGVTILGDEADWPDLAALGSAEADAPSFGIDLDPSLPCGTSLAFEIDVDAAEGSWTSSFDLETGTVGEVFSDDIESGNDGFVCEPGLCLDSAWSTEALDGANFWELSTANSNSPTHSWFIPDANQATDSALVLPRLSLPDLPAGSKLRFAHFMDGEIALDGAVLEYSIDGGAWVDFYDRITEGAYDTTIDSSAFNALVGRAAWSGTFDDWQEVEVDLDGFSGQELSIRWRFATGFTFNIIDGWYVDDVVIEGGNHTCSEPHDRLVPGALCRGDRSQPSTIRPYRCGTR